MLDSKANLFDSRRFRCCEIINSSKQKNLHGWRGCLYLAELTRGWPFIEAFAPGPPALAQLKNLEVSRSRELLHLPNTRQQDNLYIVSVCYGLRAYASSVDKHLVCLGVWDLNFAAGLDCCRSSEHWHNLVLNFFTSVREGNWWLSL